MDFPAFQSYGCDAEEGLEYQSRLMLSDPTLHLGVS